MKRTLCLTATLLGFLSFIGCKKMDSTYEQFVVPGGVTYVGKAAKATAHPGFNRIRIAWPRGTDPKVVMAKIYWNNFADSVSVDIPAGVDTVSHTFTNLEEKSYSFVIRTFDAQGNSSVPVEIISTVYGQNYAETLQNRAVLASESDNSGKLTIQWGRADISSGSVETEIKYVNNLGIEAINKVGSNDSITVIPDFKLGSIATIKTKFLPDSLAIDAFYSSSQTLNVASKLIKTNWVATANSSEPAAQLPNGGPAQKTIDNDINTFWHTNHTNAQINYPYWLAYDFKTPLTVTRIELTSRIRFFGEDFTEFIVQGSDDGTNWSNFGVFVQKENAEPQSYYLTGFRNRYLRIYMTKGTTIHSHLAEFSAYGY
jgi:hypothetical protein